jgi:hypothetical protein
MIRLAVIITDAEAHGHFHEYQGGDYYKSGKCPDQEAEDYPTLGEATRYLATELCVDTFFCRMNPKPLATETALEQQYEDIGGFGVIGLKNGAVSLKDQVVASLGTAIVSSMMKDDVSGLQTIDGVSIGSLQTSLNASIRETLAQYETVDSKVSKGKSFVHQPCKTSFDHRPLHVSREESS